MPKAKYKLIGQNDSDEPKIATAKTSGEHLLKFALCCLLLIVVVLYKTPENTLNGNDQLSHFDKNGNSIDETESSYFKYTEESTFANFEESSLSNFKEGSSLFIVEETTLANFEEKSTKKIEKSTITKLNENYAKYTTTKPPKYTEEGTLTNLEEIFLKYTEKNTRTSENFEKIFLKYNEITTSKPRHFKNFNLANTTAGYNFNWNSVSKSLQSTMTTRRASETTMRNTTQKAEVKKSQQKKTQIQLRKYYVNTTHCKMPFVDPFTPEIQKMFKPGKATNCDKDPAIISNIYNFTSRRYSLHLNTTAAQKMGRSANVSCCYRQIVRSGKSGNADKSFNLLPCANFHQDFMVPTHIDALIVNCYSNATSKSKKLVQQDAFSFIQDKLRPLIEKKPLGMRKPSVLLIGIDTLSRMNFRRNMPKTFKYLNEHDNWFELQGYNKMGDNTFPNLMALLTGYNNTSAYDKCNPKITGGLDKCPFIWQQFKRHGYRTAYAEDVGHISTFNYLKKGFTVPPTDYYLRPMVLAIEKNLPIIKKNGFAYCIGRKQYGEYIYDYALQFAQHYNDEPIFGLFWTNSFSHNSYDASSSMDYRMFEYLRTFEIQGHLDNAIVIFFSDHGCRWGSLLKLPEGFLEERLPMFFISLPQWFRQQHPDIVNALKVNRNRLTSPYDIYMTLQHVLELYEPSLKLPAAPDCALCQSIFRPVSENRTCDDVGVSEHWCTCVPYQTLSKKSDIVKQVTNLIIGKINQYLSSNKNLSSLCDKLTLKSIDQAYLKLEDEFAHSLIPVTTYRIKFVTNPKEASFQATAKYDPTSKTVTVEVETISRLNSYEKVSKCIDDKEAKKYCICKDNATPS